MNAPSRFKLWAFYAATTLVLLIAIAQVETDADANIDDKYGKQDKAWGLALSIISLISITALLVVHRSSSLRSTIIDRKPEGIIILILLIFSTGLVAIVSGPDRGLAVDKDGAVFVGNMYYFAWAGLFNGIFILSSYIESTFGINVGQTMKARSSSFTYWSALLMSSMIVMGTAADVYNRNCDVAVEDKVQPFCKRSVLAVTVGTIGVLLSLVIVIMKISLGAAPFLMEVGLAVLLFLLYIFEVAYVTDIQGPGSPLGNLYYFSWISFLLTFMVGKACYDDYVEAQIIVEQQQANRPMPTLSTAPGLDVDDESPRQLRSKSTPGDEDDQI